jgi:SAM-dependent methyltransferase
MSEHLVARGHLVLGIDIVAEAVAQARRRGVAALQRDVFDALPGEGRWDTALLADGNIGIGGDPASLLRRVAQVLQPAGRIICDLAEPGTGLRTARARLECGPHRSGHFPWALVGPEALVLLAAGCGLVVEAVHEVEGRWFGVLAR